jgi:hypothetical protein
LTNEQIDNEKTEGQHPTAVLQKWRFSASYDSEVVNQNLVLRLKFSGKNRHLRKAAKRSLQKKGKASYFDSIKQNKQKRIV